MIDIQSIQDLALIASIGVLLLVYTNLILLPILLSYVGVSPRAARRAQVAEAAEQGLPGGNVIFAWLIRLTDRKRAFWTLAIFGFASVLSFGVAQHLQVGDLDQGAPELKADSRYNKDNRFISSSFGASADVFVVVARTADGECTKYENLALVDQLEWRLRSLPVVDSTMTLASLNRSILVGLNEGSPKWFELLRNQEMINTITGWAPRGMYNDTCNTLPVLAFLSDHKADTLNSVVRVAEQFAEENSNDSIKFLLAAGNAGIDAATNDVVKAANRNMMILVYVAVTLLCLLTFRSWRATLCAVIPLVIITVMCEALMVALGIGVKVSTLPVVALGVGIGVDYALYIVSALLAQLRAGATLAQAYRKSLESTGRVVCLTGATLSIAVFVWALSPIKFQADMGILLGFMFFGNMVAALVLIPALARFLLPSHAFNRHDPKFLNTVADTTTGPIASPIGQC